MLCGILQAAYSTGSRLRPPQSNFPSQSSARRSRLCSRLWCTCKASTLGAPPHLVFAPPACAPCWHAPVMPECSLHQQRSLWQAMPLSLDSAH